MRVWKCVFDGEVWCSIYRWWMGVEMGQSPWSAKENLEQTKIHVVCGRETNPTFKKMVATPAPHSHPKKKGENLACVQFCNTSGI